MIIKYEHTNSTVSSSSNFSFLYLFIFQIIFQAPGYMKDIEISASLHRSMDSFLLKTECNADRNFLFEVAVNQLYHDNRKYTVVGHVEIKLPSYDKFKFSTDVEIKGYTVRTKNKCLTPTDSSGFGFFLFSGKIQDTYTDQILKWRMTTRSTR